MPYKDKPIEKKYYSIGEVAELFDVATSLIRFWETEFDIIDPKKNKKGNRVYTKADIENVRLVHTLVKERGYTLNGAKDHLKKNKTNVQEGLDVIDSLQKVRAFLVEMKNQLPS